MGRVFGQKLFFWCSRKIKEDQASYVFYFQYWKNCPSQNYELHRATIYIEISDRLCFFLKGDLPELQSDWWIPCMQRSRRMIPQQTMKVGKRLSSESLPLWFAWDLRLPRICKSEEYIQNTFKIYSKLYVYFVHSRVPIALGCF